MKAPSLRSQLNIALASGHLAQLRYQLRGRYAVREGVVLSAYDIPSPIFNTAAALEGETPPERVLELGREFFGAARGWSVLVEGDEGRPIEALLRARSWRVIDEMPAMVLFPIPPAPVPPAGLEIRRVVDELGLQQHLGPLDGDPPALRAHRDETSLVPANINALLIPSLNVAIDPDVALFTGYVDGRPVGTAALYRTGGIAEIGGVGVSSQYRRRGYGAALTWAAIAEGVARGCEVAALHTTSMGEHLYQGMGFRPIALHRRYTPPL
jgi:ribosomal protein S18 acetylase RimI-like enzyme